LTTRYSLPLDELQRLKLLYTAHDPLAANESSEAYVNLQIQTRSSRPRAKVFWAGRFDRQKRFDLLAEIARRMPTLDFEVWGKAVLDQSPDFSALPSNITIHQPFNTYNEIPLDTCDCWLYTSAWDGVPTILIDIGFRGVPVVASAVGGIPELITSETGWPIDQVECIDQYMDALNLRDYVMDKHSACNYSAGIAEVLASAGRPPLSDTAF
jgi:glycosyltransferase involved in cell wall biosynthesis